tara:strand:- start:3917 stop:4333 length:417 start_codon:yes stop_codon:yes gene_type:complete
METYSQFKTRQQSAFEHFKGTFYAFSDKQYDEGLEKLGITREEATNKLTTFGGGGFILKDRLNELEKLAYNFELERQNAFKDDNFLINALVYELINHEYCITYDEQDALDALGLSVEDIPSHIMIDATREALKKSEDC